MEIFEFCPKYTTTRPLTIKEMADITEKDIQLMSKLAKGYTPLIGNYYAVKDCSAIMNLKSDRENWHIEGYFSAAQIAEMCDLSIATIYTYVKRLRIPHIVQRISNYGVTWISASTLARFKKELPVKKNKTLQKTATPQNHPLVKDPRCFDLNYWPDPTPLCFKNVDQEVVD